nr:Chain A, HCMV small terminase [Human herpesvirus 5 strain Toledo]5HUY_B Chain B, HCMV small terminase [Human herpesvirus 5 strain Toledo]
VSRRVRATRKRPRRAS